MAKKKKKTEWDNNRDWSMESVANCDQLEEVVANRDHLEKGEVPLSQHEIEKLIIMLGGNRCF